MEWISVKDRLPEHYIDGKRNWVMAWWQDSKQIIKVFADNIGTDKCTATHWMPLPEPQRDENQDL